MIKPKRGKGEGFHPEKKRLEISRGWSLGKAESLKIREVQKERKGGVAFNQRRQVSKRLVRGVGFKKKAVVITETDTYEERKNAEPTCGSRFSEQGGAFTPPGPK